MTRSYYEIKNIFLADQYTKSRKVLALRNETWTEAETPTVEKIVEEICDGETEEQVISRFEFEDNQQWIHAYGRRMGADLITIGKVQPDHMLGASALPLEDFNEAVKICTATARSINDATVEAEKEYAQEAVPQTL